ncbi:pyridine nucleotide-disulfide oxidoreductase domain-containing protein 2 isoform X3 [Falco naumanni]|uniref:pyridine nucleotide-disulfide oxidoreductase domain-containing protein 2 isoform X3 n=1 Tax=Falco naumanni TaxID=148594 RepID=UPI001ADDF960|nr:pyridine nucleotide-disulfide oxidoreductase domain-containing protein 2 isoform X3 [Falco naumanni]
MVQGMSPFSLIPKCGVQGPWGVGRLWGGAAHPAPHSPHVVPLYQSATGLSSAVNWVKLRQLMCFPGTAGLCAHANPSRHSWGWGQPQGTLAATACHRSCCSQRVGMAVWRALDHGRAFALSCLVWGQARSQAASFPTAFRAVLGAFLLEEGKAPPVLQCLLAHHFSHTPPGSPWSGTGAEGTLRPPSTFPAPSWDTGWGAAGILLSTRQDLTLAPSRRWGWSAHLQALSKALPGLAACCWQCPWQGSTQHAPLACPASLQVLGHGVWPCTKASPALAPPAPPRARKPWEKFHCESKVQLAGCWAAMAGHCVAMAAGLRARLGMGCPSCCLWGWHLSPGLLGARLAHAGAAGRLQREYDAVVIGAGHNGLVAAAYLQRAGVRTAVLEKRHVLGGAAVTEEIVPGFKFSRASYLLSLLRPQIYAELELQAYPEYEAFMGGLVSALDPLLDAPPVDTAALGQGSLFQRLRALRALQPLLRSGLALGRQLPRYYEVLTAPISKILDQWFESEPLKATLATDAVIGAMASPHTPGSGYVLLHHVMGELEGRRGAWGYVAGGMGALSQAIACAAAARGAHIFAEKSHPQMVCHVVLGKDGQAQGVLLQDGTEVRSKVVLSNASPQITFLELVPQEQLPKDFVQRIRQTDTRSPVTKINVAVDRLPSFLAVPNARDGRPLPHHQCSIHLNCEGTHLLHQAFTEATHGRPSSRPMIELCIPSALDPGLAPRGCHVVSLFTQYTPSVLAGGRPWDERAKNAYADTVFDCIEAYAPGFKASVIGRDILTPPDLERIFGLPGGNIFHGGMSLDQLYFARPAPSYSGYRSPVPGLYLCGSGAHPGGGVMGAAGRNAAQVALEDFRRLRWQ